MIRYKDLHYRRTSAVARAATLLAPHGLPSRRTWREPALLALAECGFVNRAAGRAQPTHQPLRNHTLQRRSNLVRLNADIHQARNAARRIYRVERGKHQVT